MLVRITQTFETGNRRWIKGENPDVDPQIARQWIADGYAVADTDGTQDFPLMASDSLTPNLSGDSAAAVGAQSLSPRARGVIPLGDSRAALETFDTNSATSESHYTYGRGIVALSSAMAGQRVRIVRNAGIGGNTLSDILARYATDVRPFASQAKWIVLWCDLNDINAGVDLATMQARNAQLFALAAADGFTVIEMAGYAPGSGAVAGAGWSTAKTQQLVQYNSWRKAQQGARQNYVVIDAWAAITTASANPAVTPDNYLIDPTTTAFHFNVAGAIPIATLLSNFWVANLPAIPLLTTSTVDNFAADPTNLNIFDRGMFLGTAGTLGASGVTLESSPDAGFTAGVANGMTVARGNGTGNVPSTGTVFVSTGPASSGVGNAQRMRITGETTPGATYSLSLTAKPTGRAVAGATYEAFCRVVIESPNQLQAVYLRTVAIFTTNGQSKTVQCRSLSEATPLVGDLSGPLTLTLRTPQFTLPADIGNSTTAFESQLLIVFNSTVTAGAAKISCEQESFNRVA